MAIVSNTKLFNVTSALDFYNPIKDVSNSQYYVFTARTLGWQNNLSPNAISIGVTETEYQIYDEMIFGKIINPQDVAIMTNRYDWVANTVYAQYDDKDPNLYQKNFYTITSPGGINNQYDVFKCLYNANGAPSLAQPVLSQTDPTDEAYYANDGYQWKYMYSIDTSTYNKFTTADYIPVVSNSTLAAYSTNGSIDTIVLENSGNGYVAYATGSFAAAGAIYDSTYAITFASNTSTTSTTQLSYVGLDNFFTNSAIYIVSGTGAGQLRNIISYVVTSSQHQITVDNPFSPPPDFTSVYQISPRVIITGDGQGATAITQVNPVSSGILSINIIDSGLNYSYAQVDIVGNTGSTNSSGGAVARAIISPRGGHGSNVYSELYANKVGVSVVFNGNESNTISSNNQYSRIGIIKQPHFANVIVECVGGAFSTGETVTQAQGSNTAISVRTALDYNYVYTIQNFINLNLTSPVTLTQGAKVYQDDGSFANGTVTYVNNTTSVIVRQDFGLFSNNHNLVLLANTNTNTSINGISQAFTSNVYGLDDNSHAFTCNTLIQSPKFIIDDRHIKNLAELPVGSQAQSAIASANSVSFYYVTLSNSNIVTIENYTTTAILANAQYVATGKFVASNGTAIQLTDVLGRFVSVANAIGTTSGLSRQILNQVSGPVDTFNQTYRLYGSYDTGSLPFVLNDYVIQPTTGAFGYIQDIYKDNSNTVTGFAISTTKGTFQAGYAVKSADQVLKSYSVSSVIQPDLIKYTGDIVYVENITPIPRSNTQSEQCQLVLQFY